MYGLLLATFDCKREDILPYLQKDACEAGVTVNSRFKVQEVYNHTRLIPGNSESPHVMVYTTEVVAESQAMMSLCEKLGDSGEQFLWSIEVSYFRPKTP